MASIIKPKTKKAIKEHIKKDLNINTHNKYLFVFETILFIGAVEEFIEGKIVMLDINFYLNIALVMILVGSAFTMAVRFLEPLFKRTITWIVRFQERKLVRILVHIFILSILFCMYGYVYFDAIVRPQNLIHLT